MWRPPASPPATDQLRRSGVSPIRETRVAVSARHPSAGEWVREWTLEAAYANEVIDSSVATDDSRLLRGYSHNEFEHVQEKSDHGKKEQGEEAQDQKTADGKGQTRVSQEECCEKEDTTGQGEEQGQS